MFLFPVPDVTSQENQIESPNANEMTNLSSLEPINNTEMNVSNIY